MLIEKSGRNMIKDIYNNCFVIYQLTKRDFKGRYMGSLLGFVWTIIHPLVTMLVLWVILTKAFPAAPLAEGVSYIAWLATGLISWNFFSEVLSTSAGAFHEYSYLVKKINFKITLLPIAKILSSFIAHCIFVVISMIILFLSGIQFSFYWFQAVYYTAALTLMLLGLSWIVAPLQVFVKDIRQMIMVILQLGFWVTPILWQLNAMPASLRFYLRLNPLVYIVEGYRNSFIYHVPFWQDFRLMIYFWLFTIITLLIGGFIFKKLRSHFADVL